MISSFQIGMVTMIVFVVLIFFILVCYRCIFEMNNIYYEVQEEPPVDTAPV